MGKILNKKISLVPKNIEIPSYEIEGDYFYGDISGKITAITILNLKHLNSRKKEGVAELQSSWELIYHLYGNISDDEEWKDKISGTATATFTFNVDEGGVWNAQYLDGEVDIDLAKWKPLGGERSKKIFEDVNKTVNYLFNEDNVSDYGSEILESLNIDWSRESFIMDVIEEARRQGLEKRGKLDQWTQLKG